MSWSERIRRLSTLVPWTALLMAIGCGGGDKAPTGPGGGDPARFDLVALGRAGLPADVKVEDCTMTRFYGGRLTIDPASGQWLLHLEINDANYGDWAYEDGGSTEMDGTAVWFDSQHSDLSHEGTVSNSEVTILYDWCENGVADVQLVFAR
ncbi:MAG TPA: hypothetical protein VMY76_10510 [Gemmatimonadales bacterium]|nr:hypothetical protein [Gemmatimonadales bacterium]